MTHEFLNEKPQRIAYHTRPGTPGDSRPGVIFCGGFNSTMDGSKALALDALCTKEKLAFTRFDYQGHGVSDGDFVDGNIDRWLTDTLSIIDQLNTDRKHIIAGSSMGGWIATLAAKKRPDRIAGLITIAAAPDFTETLLPGRLNELQQQALVDGNIVIMHSAYDDSPYPLSPQLISESRQHCILHSRLKLDIPVRLIHGTSDDDVPHQCSIDLLHTLQCDDAQLTLVKNGDHRLSSPPQLELLQTVTRALVADCTN